MRLSVVCRSIAFVLLCVSAPSLLAQELSPEERATFDAASKVLLRRCVECHREGNASGGLYLDSARTWKAKDDQPGAQDLIDARAEAMLDRVDAEEMPPPEKGQARPLPEPERNALARWIEAGVPWPANVRLDPFAVTTDSRGGRDWWAWQPIVDSSSPASSLCEQRNFIDAYIDQRLSDLGLLPAPAADRAELIRRVTYDLTGLPVDAQDRETFLHDHRPDAYERVVDRLLASPRFGERWARQWLDVVRYADTSGYERDQDKPFAWKYRDWVIDALNQDITFEDFVVDQLAGDERPAADEQSLIATGMLRLGTWNDEPNDPQEYQYERLEDLVHVTFSSFMGLTVKCARCHDHKFDPIPQVDYYRVAAMFWAGPIRPAASELLGGPSAELLAHQQVLAWTDQGREAPDLHLLHAGDPQRPGEVIAPGFLSLLPELDRQLEPPHPSARTTQRRLQLAHWLIDRRNPLTRRVHANRLWLGHFGAGLVRSPNNFGFTGDLPTHPELLDRLALELLRSHKLSDEQTVGNKTLHRLLVTSATYRRAAEHPSAFDARQRDAANRYWWRAERRRLDAEAIRDALLFTTEELDLRMNGPGFRPTLSAEATEGLSRRGSAWTASEASEQRRRAIYEFSSRSLIDPLLTTFDFPDTTLPCGQRDQSIVAPQALTLLNDPMVDRLTQRTTDAWLLPHLGADGSLDDEQERALIDRVFHQVLARAPHPNELQAAQQHLSTIRALNQTTVEDPLDRVADGAQPLENVAPESFRWPEGLVLALLSDVGVETDEQGRVVRWNDQSGLGHHAHQETPEHRPTYTNSQQFPTLAWDGGRRWLSIDGALLKQDDCAIVAVVSDRGGEGLREILSNWNGVAGNSTTSLFLGLSQSRTLRFSDDWPMAGEIQPGSTSTLLMATNGPQGAAISRDGEIIASRPTRLSERRLDTDWVIGTQGNIDGEYWQGSISALLVFDRPLDSSEQTRVGQHLAERWGLRWQASLPPPPRTAEQRAWESLLVVLLNTNEFLYVD